MNVLEMLHNAKAQKETLEASLLARGVTPPVFDTRMAARLEPVAQVVAYQERVKELTTLLAQSPTQPALPAPAAPPTPIAVDGVTFRQNPATLYGDLTDQEIQWMTWDERVQLAGGKITVADIRAKQARFRRDFPAEAAAAAGCTPLTLTEECLLARQGHPIPNSKPIKMRKLPAALVAFALALAFAFHVVAQNYKTFQTTLNGGTNYVAAATTNIYSGGGFYHDVSDFSECGIQITVRCTGTNSGTSTVLLSEQYYGQIYESSPKWVLVIPMNGTNWVTFNTNIHVGAAGTLCLTNWQNPNATSALTNCLVTFTEKSSSVQFVPPSQQP